LDPDMDKLVTAGLVSPSWDSGPTKGIVTDSIVSFIVRQGNPKHITTWADLIKPGVQVITPNPFSSGSAKWNLMAAYGAQLALHKTKAADPTAANAFVKYLLSPAGQTVWAEQGYRPVLPKIAARFDFPTPKKLFTIASLGGWTSVDTAFFDPTTGKIAAIEQSLGQPTTAS